jgi:hypothetical protein
MSHSFLCVACVRHFGVLVATDEPMVAVLFCPFCGHAGPAPQEFDPKEFTVTVL